VKKGAPFKGSQPKGDASGKPRGACFNCNGVGHSSKDCPKLKLGNGASKVIALTSNLGQGECNRLIFLKGKLSKREVLCLLDTGASHNFTTQESAQRMGLPLEELKAPIEVHFADGVPHPIKFQAKDVPLQLGNWRGNVATPLWTSVGVKPNTWKSWRLGVFRDSRMLRARQQGAKHLALRCSWCHWKGLET